MTKREIVEELPLRRVELARRDAEATVNAIFDAMSEALSRGDRIEIRGFGTFTNRERRARHGRNPKTGAAVTIEAKRIPFFRAGKELRVEINGATDEAARRSA